MTELLRPQRCLDDRHLTWRPFPGEDGLFFWVLGVNDARQQVDLLFRLAPGARCPNHRHVGPTDTLVIEGEHRTYALVDGRWVLDQVRPPGVFASNEGDNLHYEAGGPEGTVILLSMRAVDGVIWEVLDEDLQVVTVATIEHFRKALARQTPIDTSPENTAPITTAPINTVPITTAPSAAAAVSAS
ncbi:MAG: cupin domain-containing protein [Acidimicrobiales bacterium]